MGNMCLGGKASIRGADGGSKHGYNLELKLMKAIQERARQPNRTTKSFNSILLAFPKIQHVFSNCRSLFNEFDTHGNGSIVKEDLKSCFARMGVKASDEEVTELFEESDMNHNDNISFREFLIALAILYLTRKPSEVEGGKDMVELEKTLEVIVDAFLHFDRDADGYVTKHEVCAVFNESSPGASGGMLSSKRFDEMDWDGNGKISFKEFLFAFEGWVGVEDEEDENGDAHS
eukprot:jgi/Chlat1/667/Chrsp104S01153